MKIKIAERLKPFTHIPGELIPLPKTTFAVKVYPEKLSVYSLLERTPKLVDEAFFSIKGPVEEFTATLDLERELIVVNGKDVRGYFQYDIQAGLPLSLKKAPEGLSFNKEVILPSTEESLKRERLSLGCSKKSDFTLVKRRCLMEEIVPLWFFLGQMTPSFPWQPEGSYFLLDNLKKQIAARQTIEIEKSLKNIFLAGFEGVLCPRCLDTEYQGFNLPVLTRDQTPLSILSQGAKIIRSLFIQEKEGELELLPCVPPVFHCGRILDVTFSGGALSLEWSKKQLKKCIIIPNCDGEILLKVPKDLKSVRYQKESRLLFPFDLKFKANEAIVLDRFEH